MAIPRVGLVCFEEKYPSRQFYAIVTNYLYQSDWIKGGVYEQLGS